jgi:hypothetical protein
VLLHGVVPRGEAGDQIGWHAEVGGIDGVVVPDPAVRRVVPQEGAAVLGREDEDGGRPALVVVLGHGAQCAPALVSDATAFRGIGSGRSVLPLQ